MHVAVFGAGYAGLTVARRLERALPSDVELTLVNDEPYHLVQHELHRAVRRPSVADTIRIPLTTVLDRTRVVVDRVESVEPAANTAELADDGKLSYDYAAVCLGAETNFYGLAGVEEHALPLKRLADAEGIRQRFTEHEDGRFVIGGAGLSGVQVAGELAALAEERDSDAEVQLVEMADSVAPGFDERFQRALHEALTDAGIDVRTGTVIAEADADQVTLESGESLPYDGFVWTGGIRGPDALGGERPETRAHLRVDDDTFVVGDAARVVDADGEPVPASAQAALREAKVAAANIAALVDYDRQGGDGFEPRLDRYSFTSPGWVVTVGDDAVAQVGPTVLRGQAARAAKASVGAAHLSSVGAITEASQLARDEL
ncbi:NAD(P)/FAD-dependent oxidoreductase [Halosegnis sp.]|uniref:NAD(P)/FAD-dependent oxidoreductase n=1 Tax=Halosegnis sp. TaxID=2864959 RepID=UPI0035D52230